MYYEKRNGDRIMLTYMKDKRSVISIFMIAVYNFVFLGTEYFFDNVWALCVG